MPRRMAGRVGRRRRCCCTGVVFAILIVACLPTESTTLKVAEVERSMNQTRYRTEHVETNEVSPLDSSQGLEKGENQTVVDQRDDVKNGNHPHSQPNKPTKFDLDTSDMLLTDKKSLHEAEAQRLGNLTIEVSGSGLTMTDRMDEVDECADGISMACLRDSFVDLLEDLAGAEVINITESLQIVKIDNATHDHVNDDIANTDVFEELKKFAKNHVLRINLPKELATFDQSRTFFGAFNEGKNTFLTGFGLGFLAFGLKKMLFPLFIVAQLVKSVLIALFLPSIIGTIGKIVGKSVSSYAQSSQGLAPQPEENFDFKDNAVNLYNEDYIANQPLGTLPASAMYDEGMITQPQKPEIASRYSYVDPRITNANSYSDRYYTRHVANSGQSKKQDFKIFHNIPTSSLLLTNYDPFYSPLLSRLDAVFSRLGHVTESCRRFAVCAMYRSPARYAPFSNLVSAQLSRELNELRRPSNDTPDVLRFFRYMKAAKDGQDGVDCEKTYASCDVARGDPNQRQNQAMLATYQDIDKLVHARKL